MMHTWTRWTTVVAALALLTGTAGQAHSPRHFHLRGTIADATVPSDGAWVIRGTWSLDAIEGPHGELYHADFSAALTMERSDYWLVTNPAADPELLSTRNAHTHHIRLFHGRVTPIENGFEVKGDGTVTVNGGNPPFDKTSCITVDITGNTLVRFSNLKLTFGDPASTHFGDNPIAGVVR
ncbi:MAG TPA: hypothetical protein VFX12_08380 [Vicinamibacterales bacterium]|nr:hypothetical protein [Vicinamibacterales bacterium]